MDNIMWLPISLAFMMLPMCAGLWLFAENMIARDIQELNKLNGWED